MVARVDNRVVGRAFYFIYACLIFLTGSPMAHSQDADTLEYPVKLAFLYNFTKFVEWPDVVYRDSASPLTICIVGSDPFSPGLEEELRTRKVGGRPVSLRTLKPYDTLNSCHVVFVPISARAHATRIVKSLNGSSILTVGESEGFAMQGGIINFVVEGNKLHFEINQFAAEQAGLKISSKLLNLAKIVRGQNGQRGK